MLEYDYCMDEYDCGVYLYRYEVNEYNVHAYDMFTSMAVVCIVCV